MNESATRSFVKEGNFLPLNGQELCGAGDGPALAGLDLKSPLVWVGIAGLLYFGAKLLKK